MRAWSYQALTEISGLYDVPPDNGAWRERLTAVGLRAEPKPGPTSGPRGDPDDTSFPSERELQDDARDLRMNQMPVRIVRIRI